MDNRIDPTLPVKALEIGDEIKFSSRKGHVMGYWMGDVGSGVGFYYIVKLTDGSSGYVSSGVNSKRDMFVSSALVHIGNEE